MSEWNRFFFFSNKGKRQAATDHDKIIAAIAKEQAEAAKEGEELKLRQIKEQAAEADKWRPEADKQRTDADNQRAEAQNQRDFEGNKMKRRRKTKS